MTSVSGFPALLEAFFINRLMTQQRSSPHTIASYRDAFRLLLRFAHARLRREPSALRIEDLDSDFIISFLNHLEAERGNGIRTRNVRLAAIHSFFRYVAMEDPGHSSIAQRVLSIPMKHWDRRSIGFLTRPEMDALVSAPDRATWSGRRDHALLLVALQTGLRVSELTGLRCQDVTLGRGAHVHCEGKGRKERCTPLRKDAITALRSWFAERRAAPTAPLFPNARGGVLSRDGVEYLLRKHVATARKRCPTLKRTRVSPHVLRHSTAMELLRSGVDCSVIALWLGHESMESTHGYLEASLELKEEALAKLAPTDLRPRRFRPNDHLLAFLEGL